MRLENCGERITLGLGRACRSFRLSSTQRNFLLCAMEVARKQRNARQEGPIRPLNLHSSPFTLSSANQSTLLRHRSKIAHLPCPHGEPPSREHLLSVTSSQLICGFKLIMLRPLFQGPRQPCFVQKTPMELNAVFHPHCLAPSHSQRHCPTGGQVVFSRIGQISHGMTVPDSPSRLLIKAAISTNADRSRPRIPI